MGTKISALPSGTIATTDTLPVVKSGVTTAVTFGHTHPESDITNLTSDLTGKAAASHTHAESDVTGLVTDLSNIRASINPLAISAMDTSAWSWVNQGSATLTDTSGTSFFTLPKTANTNHRGKYTSAPASTPYTITAKVSCMVTINDFLTFGLAFRESSTGKVTLFGLSSNGGFKIGATKITTDTTFVSDTLSAAAIAMVHDLYIRIANNGTNVIYSWSLDGFNFITHLSETKTTYFTSAPDQWGIAGNNNSVATQYLLLLGAVIA